MHKYFLTSYRQTKGKIHRKLSILQKPGLYLNQFSNKKGAIGKPERPKKHPIWAAHPRTHLSTKYPPGYGDGNDNYDDGGDDFGYTVVTICDGGGDDSN